MGAKGQIGRKEHRDGKIQPAMGKKWSLGPA